MKMRSDSPFAKLTKDQCERILDCSKSMTAEELVELAFQLPEPILCSEAAMRKFVRRLEQEHLLEEAAESSETMQALAKQAENPARREATLATVRQRMFDEAFETNNQEMLMEMFQALNQEKAQESARAIEERKVKVLEENAKLGWRKLEMEQARSGLKLLPRLRELLMDASKSAEERVAEALGCLGKEGAALLMGPS